MRKYIKDIYAIGILILLVGIFFYKTVLHGLLPVPTDSLIGMYHPFRDAYSKEYAQGIPYKNFLITDPVRQQIPWRKQVIEYWKQGRIPSWDAWSFSGTTLVGNIQAGVFYPLNIFFFLFSFPIAWTVLIISQPLLSSVFFYLFIRNKKIGILPSLFGSICFSYGGYAISWLTWGTIVSAFLWVPLMLFCVDKIHTTKEKNWWRVLCLFAAISSFFAGHIQLFLYGSLYVVWYALFSYSQKDMKKISLWHLFMVSGFILVTSIQWLPLLKFLGETARGSYGASWMQDGFFIPWRHIVQFIAPDFFGNPATLNYFGTWNYGEMVGYVGCLGLLFSILGISTTTIVYAIPIIICLVFAVDSPVARLPFIFHIPLISLLQPTRLIAVIGFSLSILASYGMNAVFLAKKRKILYIGIGALTVLLIIWGILTIYSSVLTTAQIQIARRNMILPTALMLGGLLLIMGVVFLKRFRLAKIGLSILILTIAVFDLFRFGWKFTPFTPVSYFFPETKTIAYLKTEPQPFRVMVLDDRVLPPNVLTYYGIESVSGYDPLHLARYEEYIASMERGEANISPPFGFERIMTPKNISSPLFRHLGVEYVLSMTPLTNAKFKLVFQEGQTMVYKYIDFGQRVYLATNIIIQSEKKKIIEELYSNNFAYGKDAVVETPISIVSSPLTINEGVEVIRYQPNQLSANVIINNKRLLVIGTIYSPYWEAFVDGKKTPIYRVNYLFMGIVVPPGKHNIDILYAPYL